MNPERLSEVLSGINALIADELAAADPGRYLRIGKLAGQAHALLLLGARRVKDVRQGPLPDFGPIGGQLVMDHNDNLLPYEGVADDAIEIGALPYVRRGMDGGDLADMVRETLMVSQKLVAQRAEPERLSPADEALRLLELRQAALSRGHDDIDIGSIDRRIETLIAAATKEEPNANPAALVHP